MSILEEWASGYQRRLDELAVRARDTLREYQDGEYPLIDPSLPINDLKGTDFPAKSIAAVRDADLPLSRRQEIVTYFIGVWFSDQVGGEWIYVPMPVENHHLYLQFGIGIMDAGLLWNAAESARDIVEGGMDLELTRKMIQMSIRTSPGRHSRRKEGGGEQNDS